MLTNDANSGWEWARTREAYLALNRASNAGRCEGGHYGCLGIATEVNHIVARIDGGGDNNSNLEALCGPCHERHTQRVIAAQVQKRREQQRQKKRRNHPGRKDRYEQGR